MKGWKKVSHANGNQKKARVAILTEDKIDFKIKTVTEIKTLHNDQKINPRRRYKNCKCICAQHRYTSVYK